MKGASDKKTQRVKSDLEFPSLPVQVKKLGGQQEGEYEKVDHVQEEHYQGHF